MSVTIVGIDPGPNGFAWAKLDGSHFTDWGEHTFPDDRETFVGMRSETIYAIEHWTAGRTLGNYGRDTTLTIGRLIEWWPHPHHILVPRERVATSLGLKRNEKRGNPQVNRIIRKLYPELADLRPLKQYRHILAACAVAHAAVGVLQAEKIRGSVK